MRILPAMGYSVERVKLRNRLFGSRFFGLRPASGNLLRPEAGRRTVNRQTDARRFAVALLQNLLDHAGADGATPLPDRERQPLVNPTPREPLHPHLHVLP